MASLTSEIPKPEFPRPQLVREDWLNLNGIWQFEIDHGDSGYDRGLVSQELADEILVPFCPESKKSGIEYTDFMQAVWYRKELDIPHNWQNKKVLLHFGAVDHDTTVWINEQEVYRHRGGFSSFTVPLEVEAGQRITIVVRARDYKDIPQARGKQATHYKNSDCLYMRTTGIWQTVWLEAVSAENYIKKLKITPDFSSKSFTFEVTPAQSRLHDEARIILSYQGKHIAESTINLENSMTAATVIALEDEDVHYWEPGHGRLYDVNVQLLHRGHVLDTVTSYAGLRSLAIEGNAILLNGKHVFQRLVLDQGYWPETLMTSPSDEALVNDINFALDAGFNGARLHQKVFEERFLYHADRLGYLVWGEFGDWGISGQGAEGHNQQPTTSFVTEWLEVLNRDYNHPSIIGWCPLNETHQVLHDKITPLDDVTYGMFLATKLADPTRPVLDASGYSHRVLETDVYDSHSYEQRPLFFQRENRGLKKGEPFINKPWHDKNKDFSLPYKGQPFFISEYGGIWWNSEKMDVSGKDHEESWGYGNKVRSLSGFYRRFKGLTEVLLKDPNMFGYCYTQLTDVFQEENGIYTFSRQAKFDNAKLAAIQQQLAAYEMRQRDGS
ncbi:MAG: glycoside hydrolase family 2 TIM barrel-domain containing protein [Micrococcaceae bacterium]